MATGKDNASAFGHECSYRCDSRKHTSNLTAAVAKASLTDEKVAAYLKWCCVKYAQALDSNGRTLIHVAAAKGRLKLLMFLLNHRNININFKDHESNYTALHRSLFYGQLHCAIRLIQSGANLQLNDFDDLTPLDHAMKDRPAILQYNTKQPCEVYVWGTNTYYNLGIGHNNSRSNPEPLGFFRKENISIKQVYMSKFHALFIGSDGKVWSCGLGSGGRLGLGDEGTTLLPKVLKVGNNSSDVCKTASIGITHSLLLMENGTVWSFGLNDYHQLGHMPPPDKVPFPKIIKSLKWRDIVGISASKFHSVFWSEKQVYTCGLHGGQLGHLKSNENTIPSPKLVTALQLKFATIEHVATSDGATVVISCKGDIYLFQEYSCKKLTSKTCKVLAKKVCILGGHLDHKVFASSLEEKGGDELKMLILTKNNNIYIWQESYPQITLCLLSLRRYIDITDMVLNKASLLLTTRDGEAFMGELKLKKRKLTENEKSCSPPSFTNTYLDNDDCNYIKMKRISNIHRAVSVSCDLKGRNFAVVQVHPKMGLLKLPVIESTEMKQNMKMLLSMASEADNLHDVVFEVGENRYAAHRYVVCHFSETIREMINQAQVVDDIRIVKIENVQTHAFERILSYLYTGELELPQLAPSSVSCDLSFHDINDGPTSSEINPNEISAFEYHKQYRSKKRSDLKVKSKSKNAVDVLIDAAKIFGLTNLTKILEQLSRDGDYVRSVTDNNFKFDRKNLQDLYDISLRGEDGSILQAHKCILIGRLEYFNCMINRGWLESSLKDPLKLKIPGAVLEILIDYLYTDEAPKLSDSHDIDLSSHVLVIADQFFCTKLREIAEASLSNLITLKNAAEMLQLAVTYNAQQLKQCSMEFICLNLSAILEFRSLEVLEDSLLTELRDFYRSWLPCMARRNIDSTSDDPDDDLVNKIYDSEPVSLDKVEDEHALFTVKTTSKTPKKKPLREKRNSESGRVRNTSVGSITSDEELLSTQSTTLFDFCTSKKSGAEDSWIMVTSHGGKQQAKNQAKPTSLKPEPQPVLLSPEIPSATRVPFVPIQKSAAINVIRPPKDRNDGFDGVFLCTSSDKEFPALGASLPDRAPDLSPKSPSDSLKKFVKLSQKQKKKLAAQSVKENEAKPEKIENIVKNAWKIPKIVSESMSDIMKNEIRTSKSNGCSITSSPPWQIPSSPPCSFPAIMAAERHEKGLIARMKSKSLEFTQMEDKAISDLMLLYDISNVTDERITIRRADSVFISPPVWVSSHR